MSTATGRKHPELPLLQRWSLFELLASEIAAQINASQSSSKRHISTSTVQRRLLESGLQSVISAKKPPLKGIIIKKRLAWAKKHEQWTLERWNLSFGLVSSYFWFQLPCLCEMQSRWTDDLRLCDSHHEAWRRRCDGVGVFFWWHCL
jgi:hypothetical protein